MEEKGGGGAPKEVIEANNKPKGVDLTFVKERNELWEKIKKKQEEENKAQEHPIKVTLPDGKQVDAVGFKDTPITIAKGISGSLAKKVVCAKVNGQMWDVWRPLEENCTLHLYDAESPEGKKVFHHSSAHILGQALEQKYAVKLCTGPPLEGQINHFFYEARMSDPSQTIHESDLADLKSRANDIIKQKQAFERLFVTKEEAIQLMSFNPYKLEILTTKVPDGSRCSLYRNGNLIDPCRGPHLPNTSYVGAFDVTLVSSSYWKADANNDALQRVYGVAFQSEKELKKHQQMVALAEARDHRKIGTAQELFFFHPLSPGSAFFLPHGTRIYNKLVEFIRGEYRKRGFTEVQSPNMFNSELWKTSGHWEHYKDDMFVFDVDKQQFGLKPMNCPGHCLMYQHRTRSYRELPLRFADFGVLHRNEAHGALTGLTRVRRFVQDDAHIFCMPEQIKTEMQGALGFLNDVYGMFGFEFLLALSTRPDKFMGDPAQWDDAEAQLKEVLDGFGKKWDLNPGDGAFYGPKIDIRLKDALGRLHQCATIQLDFQLPINFKLQYQKEDGSLATPVIIHRAVLGSLERLMAILIEHTGGKWPFWLSPRQVMIIPVDEKKHCEYAEQIRKDLNDKGYYVEVDGSDKMLAKKVALGQVGGWKVIMVVGDKERDGKSVNIRGKGEGNNKEMGLKELDEYLEGLSKNKKFEVGSLEEDEAEKEKYANKGKGQNNAAAAEKQKQQQQQKKNEKKQGQPQGQQQQKGNQGQQQQKGGENKKQQQQQQKKQQQQGKQEEGKVQQEEQKKSEEGEKEKDVVVAESKPQ